jgi:hypothetical protein
MKLFYFNYRVVNSLPLQLLPTKAPFDGHKPKNITDPDPALNLAITSEVKIKT